MEANEPKNLPAMPASNLLLGIGVLLLGLGALMVAAQWETHPTYSVEMPSNSEGTKYGFTLTTEREESLGQTEVVYYLLDRDTGRIWKKGNEYTEKWEEIFVQGITPESSPAFKR